MQYNFTEVINRFHTDSLKWNVKSDELPMWVADMDFRVAPEILEALRSRVEHGIFGYSVLPDEYYTSIMRWWHKRYGFVIQKEWILFSTGVIPAIDSIIRTMSNVGDTILVQSPVYHVFYRCIEENQRNVLCNELCYENGEYFIDFDLLDKQLSQVKIMILCSPHNPIGKIWDKETLAKIGDLCAKHNVLVIADEIHCDITDKGYFYTPFASVNETCANISISTFSPSKTFNIADLHSAFVVITNQELRKKIHRTFQIEHTNSPNIFGIAGSIAAYNKGEKWLESLQTQLAKNKQMVDEFLQANIPNLKLVQSHATYLLWIDCSLIAKNTDSFCAFLRKSTGLYISHGSMFGKGGESFFRLNIACPQETLLDGLRRLQEGVLKFVAQG